jgi:DNA polymerase-4
MDAFFVEVERLRRPELRGRPVVVGGGDRRGVVASASYEARAFGVHSAQPTAQARRACPNLIVVPPDHHHYGEVSEHVFEVFRSFSPLVEGLSLDEAFIDISGLRLLYEDAPSVGFAIRTEIRDRLSLPASVGIASNKLIAKLASETAKPDGLRHVPVESQLEFLHALPVRSLWGVGEASQAALDNLGVNTIGDLAAVPEEMLAKRIGAAAGHQLALLAAGIDDRVVVGDADAKSISVEQTYQIDLHGRSEAETELFSHCDRLAGRLRRAGLASRTVSIKVRYTDFTTITRSLTLAGPSDVARDLWRAASTLAERVEWTSPVRLLGVAASSLEPAGAPLQLAVDRPAKWDDLAGAVEQVRSRFGEGKVGPARLRADPSGRRPD